MCEIKIWNMDFRKSIFKLIQDECSFDWWEASGRSYSGNWKCRLYILYWLKTWISKIELSEREVVLWESLCIVARIKHSYYERLACEFAIPTTYYSARKVISNDVSHIACMILLVVRWDDVEKLIQPVKDYIPKIFPRIQYLICKQKLLECLSWQNGGHDRWAYHPWKPMQGTQNTAENDSAEIDKILELINNIKPLCSVQVIIIKHIITASTKHLYSSNFNHCVCFSLWRISTIILIIVVGRSRKGE